MDDSNALIETYFERCESTFKHAECAAPLAALSAIGVPHLAWSLLSRLLRVAYWQNRAAFPRLRACRSAGHPAFRWTVRARQWERIGLSIFVLAVVCVLSL